MWLIRCVLATVLIAGVVTGVSAQPIATAWGDDINTLLLTNAALQTEIKLTAEQKGKLKSAADKQATFNKEFTEAFGPAAAGAFDPDKFSAMRARQAALAAEVKAAVDDALAADQQKRIKQIALQAMSFTVFNDPDGALKIPGYTDAQKAAMNDVRAALKLSDEQKKTVKSIADGFTKERRKIVEDAGLGAIAPAGTVPDPEKVAAVEAKIDQARKEVLVKVEGVLNEAQKKAWKDLVGEPFDLIKLRTAPKK